MQIIQLNSTFKECVQSNHSLTSYLNNLSKGRPATPHSWLYENEKSEKTLKRWMSIMTAANLNSEFGNRFNQFEERQLSKFGPQGKVPPFGTPETLEVLEPLYSPSEFDDPQALSQFFSKTKEFAQVLFGSRLQTKRRLSFESVIDDMKERDTLVTNSGYPDFSRRSTVKQKAIEDAKSGKAYSYPAILLFRQYNGKLRPVWMYPMAMNLCEYQFTQVIQKQLRESPTAWVRDYLSPWEGYEAVKATLTQTWTGQPIVGGDTTKMDAHMRPAQLNLVFEIVKWLFQKSEWEDLYKTIERVNTIELLVGVDQMITGLHGLASGAGWTQLSETVLQLFMAWLKPTKGQGIGDDFVWLDDMTADELVKYLATFGLPANPEKQSIGEEETTFLQRLNVQGFFSREDSAVLGGYYPTIRALNSSLHPEKFHKPSDWNSDMFCIRQFMILENCVDDPCFPEFVKFVVNGHKDLESFAKKADSELAQIQRRARLIPGLCPSYNQEKRDKPLATFVSIQLAKSM